MVDLEKTIRKLIGEVKGSDRMSLINEGGFSRVRQMMLGLVPTIDTLGILTAQNPGGVRSTPAENKEANKNLMGDLITSNYGVIPIEGSYGGPENSFLIPNMTKADAIELGIKYGQEAVIWGLKVSEKNSEPFFRFEYIEGDTTVQTRDVSLGSSSAQEREDFYSAKKGRKFWIPFFDDAYEGAKFTQGNRTISFTPDDLTGDPKIESLVRKINKHVELSLQESRTPKSRWHHRRLIKEYKKRLDKSLHK